MKKMRRMIPALCMLLVSAIMLSTASYAWFTMNEQVTASGMQIQAKASGSLVISSDPLQAATAAPNVKFDTTVTQLTPIHLEKVTTTTETPSGEEGGEPVKTTTTTGSWQKPYAQDQVYPQVINPILGTPDYRGLDPVTPSMNLDYVEQVIYVGTSGSEGLTNGKFTVTLNATASAADATVTKAYSVAVYVLDVVNATKGTNGWTNVGTTPDTTAAPDEILHADLIEDANGPRYTADIDLTGKTIPSIVGYGDGNDYGTGLKIVLRFYVDGALMSYNADKKEVGIGYAYTPATGNYSAAQTYWRADGYIPVTKEEKLNAAAGLVPNGWFSWTDSDSDNVVDEGEYGTTAVTVGTEITEDATYCQINYRQCTEADLNGATTVPSTWLTRTEAKTYLNYNYVNNDTIPSLGSSLSISFKYLPPAPETPEQDDQT